MKHKWSSLALALAGGLLAAQASALPFSLGGYTGGVQIKYNNQEVLTLPSACVSGASVTACDIASPNTANGGDNYGIIKVTSILDASGFNTLWFDGKAGVELTGVFEGIGIKDVKTGTLPGTFQIDSVGGTFALYLNPVGTLTSAGITPANFTDAAKTQYTGITGGDPFLSGIFGPGILATDPTVTVTGTTQNSAIPPRGSSSAYLDVTGGPQQSRFDTNGQNGHDMLLANNFTPDNAQGGFTLSSFDPIIGKVIPEPGTLALLGLTLAGLGLARRRSN